MARQLELSSRLIPQDAAGITPSDVGSLSEQMAADMEDTAAMRASGKVVMPIDVLITLRALRIRGALGALGLLETLPADPRAVRAALDRVDPRAARAALDHILGYQRECAGQLEEMRSKIASRRAAEGTVRRGPSPG